VSLSVLKQRIAEILDPPRADADGLPTGIAELDRAMSGGGVPRGRLTEVLGPRGSGKTTLVHRIVERAVEAKLWIAYIDAGRTLAPADWARVGEREGMWMIRPADPSRGAWCADVLLRSGAFALVVLDGAPALPRQIAVRLTRLARESDAAFVIVGDESHGATVGGALRLRVRRSRNVGRRPRGTPLHALHNTQHPTRSTQHATPQPSPIPHPRRSHPGFSVTIEKGGTHHTVEVSCAIGVARRLCANPEVPDRRGVAPRRGSSGSETRARGATVTADPAGRGPQRKRRCAEPAVGRDAFRTGTI
jgi:hypothetical protein